MSVRKPCALHFYASECTKERIEQYLEHFQAPEEPLKVVAGIVPHAGWMYSGAVAAKVFQCIKEKNNPDTFILYGAIHSWGVEGNAVYADGSWSTPFGDVDIDEPLADTLFDSLGTMLVENPNAHSTEHSLEVQLPFIKYLFPEASIVPIAIVPDANAASVGTAIGNVVAEVDKEVVVVGSTDLTHYGMGHYGFAPKGTGPEALQWMKNNDKRIVDLALSMKAESIVEEADNRHNACGSGAMSATVASASAMGAEKGILLEYTTSYDVFPEREFNMGVGYAGIVF